MSRIAQIMLPLLLIWGSLLSVIVAALFGILELFWVVIALTGIVTGFTLLVIILATENGKEGGSNERSTL